MILPDDPTPDDWMWVELHLMPHLRRHVREFCRHLEIMGLAWKTFTWRIKTAPIVFIMPKDWNYEFRSAPAKPG